MKLNPPGLLALLLVAMLTPDAAAQSLPGWTLVWADEFTQANGTNPDSSKWGYELGGSGWGNNELEYYTDRTENARIESGALVIEARAEAFGGKNYTSARLLTRDKRSWTYGRMEARIKVPRGKGIWPAFWTLGSNIDSAGWPLCGEIDIMENIGSEPSIVHGTLHGPGYSGAAGISGSSTLAGAALADDFHVYAIEWEENRIRWFIDGQQYFTLTPGNLPNGSAWIFNQPQFILLNLAVGGNWPGSPNGSTTFPQRMTVDYVRVYAPAAVTPTDTVVTVDPAEAWLGYMRVSNLPANGGAYLFGQTWATADLHASFSGPVLTLSPNTISDASTYWYLGGGAPGHPGNKIMDASMYVEKSGSLAGKTVVFTGTVLTRTLTAAHSSVAFIKDFAPDYSTSNTVTAPLVNGTFSLSLATNAGAGRHVQYGFETTGVNVWVTDVAPFGKLQVGPVLPPAFAATLETGTLVSWTANADNSYQPQRSTDGIGWTDLGAPATGNAVSSLFDSPPAPFYQVLETTPDLAGNLVSNPGFETTAPASPANPGAAGWEIVVAPNPGASMAVVTSYAAISPHQGLEMLKLESTGPGSPAPNTDVRSGFIPVTGNTGYDFSFYAANPVKTGGGNPQLTLFFYDGSNAPTGNSFTSFAAVGSAWTKVSMPFTTPAGTARMTIGWIGGAGADANVHWVTLLDDAWLSNGTPVTPGFTVVIPATVAPAVKISWPTRVGKSYQVKSSVNLVNWADFGGSSAGSGSVFSVTDLITPPGKFYRVFETTP